MEQRPGCSRASRTVASSKRQVFSWDTVSSCAGGAWEIGVKWDESKRTTVFRIAAPNAAGLRMLSVGTKASGECTPSSDPMGTVAKELAR